MNHSEHWRDADKAELAEIEQSVIDAREQRRKLFAKIRQRAWRAKR